MAESLFDIFTDHLTRQAVKNVSRQPMSNAENMGKAVLSGPIKPNEPVKNAGNLKNSKKSFLSNTGKALQSTPVRIVFTPRSVNVGPLIYTDKGEDTDFEEIEFTKPAHKYGKHHCELLDYIPEIVEHVSPPSTPTPDPKHHSMELNCSYQDEFFTDDFSIDSLDEDLGLPDIY